MAAGSWQRWQSLGASSSSWDEIEWDKKCQEVETGINDFTRVERIEGFLNVKIGGKFEPIYQESTWKEHEERTTGLDFKLKGKLRCILTGKLTTHEQSEYAERIGPVKV